MSEQKKQVRKAFRDAVFGRDGHCCVFCPEVRELDAHHITPRTDMPNGGYVEENGITLCVVHHRLAEGAGLYQTPCEITFDAFDAPKLYEMICSSYEEAVAASEKL